MPKSDTTKKPKKKSKKTAAKRKKTALTDKQIKFCKEYVDDNNATQAAIRAGYSEKTAYSMGARLLKKVEIQNEIFNIRNDIAKSAEITRDSLLAELKKIGFADIDYSMIQARDKLKALDTIAKMLGLEHPDFSGEIEDISEQESEIFD